MKVKYTPFIKLQRATLAKLITQYDFCYLLIENEIKLCIHVLAELQKNKAILFSKSGDTLTEKMATLSLRNHATSLGLALSVTSQNKSMTV